MSGSRLLRTIVVMLNAVFWGVPTVIFSILVWHQYAQGTGSLLLALIGPFPYATGFVVSTYGAVRMFGARDVRFGWALSLCALLLGLPVTAWGILMLGST